MALAPVAPQVITVAGTPTMAFVQDGQIYFTTFDGTQWAAPAAVGGAEGNNPQLVYSSTLIDGMTPKALAAASC